MWDVGVWVVMWGVRGVGGNVRCWGVGGDVGCWGEGGDVGCWNVGGSL